VEPIREQFGLTEEQATTPIRINEEMWTILEAARYLYNAPRSGDYDPQKVLLLMVEFDRLREEAEDMEDPELIGAADALEKSAREMFLDHCDSPEGASPEA
jgi:hypothetical protein